MAPETAFVTVAALVIRLAAGMAIRSSLIPSASCPAAWQATSPTATNCTSSSIPERVEYNAQLGTFDVTTERDGRTAMNQGRRKTYRFQVQGPDAPAVMEAATGAPTPDIRFFHMGAFTIGGSQVRALRHGMVGQPGWDETPSADRPRRSETSGQSR